MKIHVINAVSEQREERRMGATAQLMSDFQMSRVPPAGARPLQGLRGPDHPLQGEPAWLQLPGERALGQTQGACQAGGAGAETGAGGGGGAQGLRAEPAPPRPGTWYAPGPNRSFQHP